MDFSMHRVLTSLWVLVMVLTVCEDAHAATFIYHPWFTTNMVLQRDVVNTIFGVGTRGAAVTVTLNSAAGAVTATTTVGTDESWSAQFAAQSVSTRVYTITASQTSGTTTTTLTLTNILFGDVFLCSGQSNMGLRVDQAWDSDTAVTEAAAMPLLRLFNTGASTSTYVNNYPTAFTGDLWQLSSSKTTVLQSSAVCFHTASHLYRLLNGAVPIGIVSAAVGGTTIETWAGPNVINACASKPAPGLLGRDVNQNSFLWNGTLESTVAHMQFKTFVWYQAEFDLAYDVGYACRFPAFITDIRRTAAATNPSLPVLFFLLHPFTSRNELRLANMRAAQMQALTLSKVYMASAIDLYDPTAPLTPIHPRNKTEVGRRGALQLAHYVYGSSTLISEGPSVASVAWGTTTITVTFTNGQGLFQRGTAACNITCCTLSPFQLCSTTTTLDLCIRLPIHSLATNTAVVTVPSTATYTYFRIMYEDIPSCGLYNSVQLPVVPIQLKLTKGSSTTTSLAVVQDSNGDSSSYSDSSSSSWVLDSPVSFGGVVAGGLVALIVVVGVMAWVVRTRLQKRRQQKMGRAGDVMATSVPREGVVELATA